MSSISSPQFPPLSVLDLVPVQQGATPGEALRHSLALAQHAEQLGFTRYWVAEHHNMTGIASAATSVVIGFLAQGTSRIRVGSGGIMLPNHSPLVIAEQFGTLASLYPGRIDCGLGRAPGTDQVTVRAMRRDARAAESFPEDVQELQALFQPTRPGQAIQAFPGAGTDVPLWILGSSTYGAQLAAALGLPYAFASHFAPDALTQAMELYRHLFKPSEQLQKPHAMAGVNVDRGDPTFDQPELRRDRATAFIPRDTEAEGAGCGLLFGKRAQESGRSLSRLPAFGIDGLVIGPQRRIICVVDGNSDRVALRAPGDGVAHLGRPFGPIGREIAAGQIEGPVDRGRLRKSAPSVYSERSIEWAQRHDVEPSCGGLKERDRKARRGLAVQHRPEAERVPARERRGATRRGLDQEQPCGSLPLPHTQHGKPRIGQDVRPGQPEPVEPVVEPGLVRTIERTAGVGGDGVEIVIPFHRDRHRAIPRRELWRARGRYCKC